MLLMKGVSLTATLLLALCVSMLIAIQSNHGVSANDEQPISNSEEKKSEAAAEEKSEPANEQESELPAEEKKPEPPAGEKMSEPPAEEKTSEHEEKKSEIPAEEEMSEQPPEKITVEAHAEKEQVEEPTPHEPEPFISARDDVQPHVSSAPQPEEECFIGYGDQGPCCTPDTAPTHPISDLGTSMGKCSVHRSLWRKQCQVVGAINAHYSKITSTIDQKAKERAVLVQQSSSLHEECVDPQEGTLTAECKVCTARLNPNEFGVLLTCYECQKGATDKSCHHVIKTEPKFIVSSSYFDIVDLTSSEKSTDEFEDDK